MALVTNTPAKPEIVDHKLTFARWKPSANHGGLLVRPTLLIIHYTAGNSLASAITTLCDARKLGPPKVPGGPPVKLKRKSANLVIGRAGEAVQLVAFNRVAWHAGESEWRGKAQTNLFSIGIELDNAGWLEPGAPGRWHTRGGKSVFYTDAEVLMARHKSGGPERAWHRYSSEQLETLERAAIAIVRAYPSIKEIVGHEDVNPSRKTDPGPAFPMHEFRTKVLASR